MRTRTVTQKSALFAILAIVAAVAAPARADKTLMWLTDWYQGNLDSVSITQVSIPHYGDTGKAAQGFYFGKTDLILTRTKAYAPPIRVNTSYDNTGKPDSLRLPKTMDRFWYAQPGFNTGNFRGGMVNVMVNFNSFNHRYQAGPPPKVQMDIGKGTGQTGQLNQSSSSTPGFLDNCVSSINADTIWIRMPAADTVINPGYTGDKLVCTDHNPFFVKVGTIHVYNPWPGKSLYVQQGNTWYPLYPERGRLGWQSTTLWAPPTADTSFKVRIASGKPSSSGVQYMDAQGFSGVATGPVFDFSATPGGERWIMPPTAAGLAPAAVAKAPAVRTVLMVQRPHWGASGVRILWKGSDARYIAGSTQYCEWYSLPLYEGAVPDSIVLQHPLADTLYGTGNQVQTPSPISSFKGWIALTGNVKVGDTTWLIAPNVSGASIVARPASQLTTCNTKILAFSAYDYAEGLSSTSPYFYAPFAETNSGVNYPAGQNKGKTTDNCPDAGGGATKGLVLPNLDANGRPVWSGKIDCDIGKEQDGPQYWFDPLTIAGTRINAFKCVPITLTLDPSDGYYKYSNGAFFPLNNATPAPYGPANGTNYHFAMHAKASFEYVRGLTFKFKGDDDVWIFIDRKLALDLGGQHGEMPGEIDLDKLGLVEGKSYQFDMFYSERHQTGSNIGIQTTMNLVPTVEVLFDTAASTGGARDVKVKTIETTLDPSKCAEEGSTSQRKELPGRSNIYLLRPDGTQDEVDTLQYASVGLKVTEMFSHITIDTAKLKKSGLFTQSGTYTILISIGTEEIRTDFTMVTENVDARGTMFDRDGDGRADSAFVHGDGISPAFKNPALAKLRWADVLGVADTASAVAAQMTTVPGDSAVAIVFAPLTTARTSCPPEGCTGAMGRVWGIASNGDTVKNRLVELADGIAPVADSAWMVYDTTGTGKDILYVRASEPLVAFSGTVPAGTAAHAITGRTGASSLVAGTVAIAGNLLALAIDPATNPVQSGDSIRLGGFAGDAVGNSPGARSKWVPLHADAVARSWMLDRDGDGSPDSVGVASKGSLSAATVAVVNWKTAAGLDTAITVPLASGIVNGFRLPAGILPNATSCTGCRLEVTMGTVRRFALQDSVAPVAVEGSLVFGLAAGDPDTLRIKPSEAIAAAAAGTWAQLAMDSGSTTSTLLSAINADKTISVSGELQLVVPSGSGIDAMAWVRLGGAVSDANGNAVGASSRWVRLSVRPSGRAALYDADGDGRADSLHVFVRGAMAGSQAVLNWKTATGAADVRSWNIAPSNGSFGVKAPTIAQAFAFGATSCTGCTVVLQDAAGTKIVEWPLADSVAPVALDATYRFGALQDTLSVVFSEPVAGASTTATWLEWGNAVLGGAIAQTNVVPTGSNASFLLSPANGAVDGWDSLRLAAGVRAGNVVDANGKTVGAKSPWAPIHYGVAPFQAWLLDPMGQGRGTHARFSLTRSVPKAAIAALDSFRLSWTSVDGSGLDVQSVAATNLVWDGVSSWTGDLVAPFAQGRTGCVGTCTAEGISATGGRGYAALQDSIAPVAVRARLRYASAEIAQDTLVLNLSEAWVGDEPTRIADALAWVGSRSNVRELLPVRSWVLTDPTTLRLVIGSDVSGSIHTGDSARLAWLATGSRISDVWGNRVGALSPWVEVEFGLRPPLFSVGPYRPMLVNSATIPGAILWDAPPATNPRMELLERLPGGGFAKLTESGAVASGTVLNDTALCLGIEIRVNRPIDARVIIYDNLGNVVASENYSRLNELWSAKKDQERTIRIQWNATGADHKFVSSGVYLVRVVTRFDDGEGNLQLNNQIWKLGFYRKAE